MRGRKEDLVELVGLVGLVVIGTLMVTLPFALAAFVAWLILA